MYFKTKSLWFLARKSNHAAILQFWAVFKGTFNELFCLKLIFQYCSNFFLVQQLQQQNLSLHQLVQQRLPHPGQVAQNFQMPMHPQQRMVMRHPSLGGKPRPRYATQPMIRQPQQQPVIMQPMKRPAVPPTAQQGPVAKKPAELVIPPEQPDDCQIIAVQRGGDGVPQITSVQGAASLASNVSRAASNSPANSLMSNSDISVSIQPVNKDKPSANVRIFIIFKRVM